jgi:transcriptional regulator with XRE-family HTH domain
MLEILKQARKDCKLNQKEVAAHLGLKGNTISNWENGVSQPDIDSFIQLCKIYNLDFTSLLNNIYGTSADNSNRQNLSYEEQNMIKKYRCLPSEGKATVDAVIDIQYNAVMPKIKNDEVG